LEVFQRCLRVHRPLLLLDRKPALQVSIRPPLKQLLLRQLIGHGICIQPASNFSQPQMQKPPMIVL